MISPITANPSNNGKTSNPGFELVFEDPGVLAELDALIELDVELAVEPDVELELDTPKRGSKVKLLVKWSIII